MHDQIEPVGAEELHHRRAVTDVDGVVGEVRRGGLQPAQVPQRVAFLAEELAPHVVVHAVDFVPGPVIMLDGFGADEAAAAGYKNFHRVLIVD